MVFSRGLGRNAEAKLGLPQGGWIFLQNMIVGYTGYSIQLQVQHLANQIIVHNLLRFIEINDSDRGAI